jgi:dUTP pyrophosphatase
MTQMEIKVKRNGNTTLPRQATDQSAGYDIIATSDPKIVGEKLDNKFFLPDEPKIEWWKHVFYIEYETGLFMSPSDKNIHTLIYPRSSISSKTNMVLANSIGLVDCDYRGQILCRFRYIWQPFDMAWLSIKDHSNPENPYVPMTLGNINPERIYKKGDTIAQLVFSPTINVGFQFVDELDQTIRNEGGFGSTDQQANTPPQAQGDPFSLGDRYNQAGGIPTRKRYSDEMKERERVEGTQKSTNKIHLPPPGIHERKAK